MCGLAGLFDPTGRLAPELRLRQAAAMAQRLAHRGPDDAAAWADAAAGIALGFRRLAIIDLSPAGRQPMLSQDGRFVVAYNGEIYNHRALREGLAVNWRGHSDTEALVESIAARGFRRTLERLDGMFAIACWDRERRELLLARDPFGEKPLYYGRHDGVFAFASELKAFKALDGWSPALDRAALGQFLRYAYVPAPRTAYAGWTKLPPGHWLAVGARGGEGPQPYWSALHAIVDAEPFAGDAAAAEDALDRHLCVAVATRMESDVPLGVFLSGGIDSSAVVAAMRAAGGAVKSFTIAFPGTRYDEAPHAAAVARHLGTAHTEMAVTERDAQAIVPELANVFDEPFADASAIPTLLLSRLTRQHVTVALSGDGGDELFAGYPRHQSALAAWHRLAARPRLARRLASGAAHLMPRRGHRSGRLARRLDQAGYDSFPRLFRDSVTQWHDADLAAPPPPDLFDAPPGPSGALRQALALDTATYLPDDLLVKSDRCAMAASLETRAPFLARDFAAFTWSLPDGLVASKHLLRRVLYRYVPPALVDRPKQGFEAPVGPWLRGALKDWAAGLLEPARLAHGLLDAAAVRRCWAEHSAGRRNHTYRLWTVLMLQAWLAAEGRG